MQFRFLSLLVSGLVFGVCGQAGAQTGADAGGVRPAVDGPNGKFEVFGGLARGEDLFGRSSNGVAGGAASMTVPLGHSFGLQVDLLAAGRGGGFAGGAGSHLFWRDPDRVLLGVYGAFTSNEKAGVRRGRGGVEGELYLGRFTLSGVAGVERTTGSNLLVANFPDRSRFFNSVDMSYYALDNLRLSVGHRYSAGTHAAAAGVEYQFAASGGLGYAAFVEGRLGQDSYRALWGGLRVYFGQKDKTLIRRHREDDPAVFLHDNLHAPTGLGGLGKQPQAPTELNCELTPENRLCDT